MRTKSFFLFIVLFLTISMSAQNLQLHFDSRHAFHSESFPRNYFTTTFEMFKPDKWGSTFMFVDLDFSKSKGNIGLVYTEIARDQNLGKLPFKAHVEFNGGHASAFDLDNAYLLGLSKPFSLGVFNINTYLAYKLHTFQKSSNDVQWTLTWFANFFNDKLTFSGFFDLWTENKNRLKNDWKSGKKVVILTEPQLWYNMNKNLSFGTELEFSDNFLWDLPKSNFGTFINPTLAVKWNFN